MGKLTDPKPVKLFIGMLSHDVSLFDEIKKVLKKPFGKVDMESDIWPWEHTQYYEQEMGPGLKRKFIFFRELIDPSSLANIKLKTIELEQQYLHENDGRKINLDPGYLDSAKVVLASTKDFSHRIYLKNGIFGEVTLIYSKKDYQILPYTFPDYRTPEYLDIFRKARDRYGKQARA